VHLFESGRANPSAKSLELLAERLGVPVESLLRSTSRQPEASPSLPDERYEHLLETNRFDEVRQFALDTLAQVDAGLRLRALAHHYLGQALCHLARPDEALEHLRQARGLAEAMGDPWLAAESQGWEATVLYARDDPEALAVGQAALDRYRLLSWWHHLCVAKLPGDAQAHWLTCAAEMSWSVRTLRRAMHEAGVSDGRPLRTDVQRVVNELVKVRREQLSEVSLSKLRDWWATEIDPLLAVQHVSDT
jgi:transcriptional regulator with XRE-family HTH domain